MAEGTVRLGRKNGFTVIDNSAIRDKRISLPARGLFALMLSLPAGKPHSFAYIQKTAGCGRDALRGYFRELESAGYMIKEQTHVEHGKFGANSYVLYDISVSPSTENPSTVKPSTAEPATDGPATDGPATENPSTKEINTRKNIPPIIPQWKPERFVLFWEYYRKHARGEARDRAVKAWDKLKPDDDLIATIGRALQRQVASEMWQSGVGVPYASTYLNGRRWEDAPDGADRPRGRPPERQEEAFGEWH